MGSITILLDGPPLVVGRSEFNGVSFGVAVRKGRIEALERAGGYNDNWIGWAILALVAAFLIAGWVMQGG
jgi:hypothetical protein